MNLDLEVSIDCHCRGGITQLFTHLNSLPDLPLSAVVAPPPPLPPDQDLYPAFPAVLVEASHPKCLDTAVSKPPPPPATIKGVLLPLTINVAPPPPELDALRVSEKFLLIWHLCRDTGHCFVCHTPLQLLLPLFCSHLF